MHLRQNLPRNFLYICVCIRCPSPTSIVLPSSSEIHARKLSLRKFDLFWSTHDPATLPPPHVTRISCGLQRKREENPLCVFCSSASCVEGRLSSSHVFSLTCSRRFLDCHTDEGIYTFEKKKKEKDVLRCKM